jgi:hypothetical protein
VLVRLDHGASEPVNLSLFAVGLGIR